MVSVSQREAQRRTERIDRKAAAESSSALAKAAMGIGAAFLVYQRFGQRWMREQVAASPQPITRRRFVELANTMGAEGIDRFVLTAIPPLVAGYANGLKEAKIAQRNPVWIQRSAEHYANRLGKHIHDVSAEAMIDGFTAQLNRRVPARMAADRVIDAFGVAPKTMKALVNVWLGPAPKESPTAKPLGNPIKERADKIIADAIANRANAVAESEAFSAKNQAKTVMWNWQASKGELPDTARVVWYTAKDERVCPECAPMHGKTRKVTEQFRLPSGEHVWAPQVHPHCRCDVVLVQKVTQATLDMSLRQAQMLDEARELVSVAKSSAWERKHQPKRDQGGRFARVESRQRRVKERAPMDAGVADVMRQARESRSSPPQDAGPQLVTPQRAQLVSAPRLAPRAQLRQEAQLVTPAESAQLVTPQAQLAQPELIQPELVEPKLTSAQLVSPEVKLVPLEQINLHKPEMAEGNDKWIATPENRPLYVSFDDVMDRDGPETFIAGDTKPFYDSYENPAALQQSLSDYWSEVYNQLPEVFWADSYTSADGQMLVRDGDATYYLGLEDYISVFDWALTYSGQVRETLELPVRRSGSARDLNIMDPSADLGMEEVDLQFLASKIGIDEMIDHLTPTVGVAYHINSEAHGSASSEAISNPGRWRIVGGDQSLWMRDEGTKYHYNLVYIEPEDI